MPKVKGVELTGLTKRQVTAMRNHARHHTIKHLREMAKAMKKGKTFYESHVSAQKKVGK
tara:strand:- start:339 stop:515 length:177 start_codon:yes stop_codon:yes gene_type:complete